MLNGVPEAGGGGAMVLVWSPKDPLIWNKFKSVVARCCVVHGNGTLSRFSERRMWFCNSREARCTAAPSPREFTADIKKGRGQER